MGAFSDYLEGKILAWAKGTTMPSAPSTLYVGLLTVAPADTGTAGAPSDGTEVSGNNYARVAVAWNAVTASGTTQQMTNNGVISFPTPSGSWGTVVAWGIWDASSAGNLLFWDTQTPNKTISTSDVVQFADTVLVVSVD